MVETTKQFGFITANQTTNQMTIDYLFLEVNLHHLSLGHQNEEGLVKSSLSKG